VVSHTALIAPSIMSLANSRCLSVEAPSRCNNLYQGKSGCSISPHRAVDKAVSNSFSVSSSSGTGVVEASKGSRKLKLAALSRRLLLPGLVTSLRAGYRTRIGVPLKKLWMYASSANVRIASFTESIPKSMEFSRNTTGFRMEVANFLET
ncbi:unnamed protein product, partial [Owenia fusiformis]